MRAGPPDWKRPAYTSMVTLLFAVPGTVRAKRPEDRAEAVELRASAEVAAVVFTPTDAVWNPSLSMHWVEEMDRTRAKDSDISSTNEVDVEHSDWVNANDKMGRPAVHVGDASVTQIVDAPHKSRHTNTSHIVARYLRVVTHTPHIYIRMPASTDGPGPVIQSESHKHADTKYLRALTLIMVTFALCLTDITLGLIYCLPNHAATDAHIQGDRDILRAFFVTSSLTAMFAGASVNSYTGRAGRIAVYALKFLAASAAIVGVLVAVSFYVVPVEANLRGAK